MGHLTLIDLDEVCFSNLSRQAETTRATTGELKVDALAERVLAINPYSRVRREANFLDKTNAAQLLSPEDEEPFDCVIDCLDDFVHKSDVIAHCVSRGVPVVSTGVAAGSDNAAAVRVVDMGLAPAGEVDDVIRRTRKRLTRDHRFTAGGCADDDDDDDNEGAAAATEWGSAPLGKPSTASFDGPEPRQAMPPPIASLGRNKAVF